MKTLLTGTALICALTLSACSGNAPDKPTFAERIGLVERVTNAQTGEATLQASDASLSWLEFFATIAAGTGGGCVVAGVLRLSSNHLRSRKAKAQNKIHEPEKSENQTNA